MQEHLLFLSRWLRDPRRVGAIAPSGRMLARAMAEAARAAPAGVILELGPGTGAVTQALLETGVDRERIVALERDPELYQHLRQNYPGIQVLHGDATKLGKVLADHGIDRIGAVVSSLPRVGWTPLSQAGILRQCFQRMDSDGFFLEYSYSPVQPVPERLLRALGLRATRVRRIWANAPPATVWRYQLQLD